ncbi:MAG: hypothetical protein CVV49_17375 [Spirochaetae bacterium HGW-Spirochaetae-5]|nr:MAG: hypothetical protein CVV49_17375 [Spirochaetae bacterium HGW-Spirochaetae-5]
MSIKKVTVCFIYLAIGFILSCTAAANRNNLLNDGYHNVADYKFDPATTLESRIQVIPDSIIKSLMRFDKRNDYQPYMPTAGELKMFAEYIKVIPSANRQVIQSSLVRIHFVKNFIGAGMTDFILSKDRKVYTILYINPSVFTTGISEWLTYRENSMFKNNDNAHVKVDCGKKYTAFMYVLLHETSHIVDYVYPRTPYTDPNYAAAQGLSGGMTPFVEGLWVSYKVMDKKTEITESRDLHAYGLYPATIDASKISSLYEKLSRTPVMSAYSSKSWAEDFADTITFYHLTQKLKQPSEKGKSDVVYQPMKTAQPPARLKVINGMYESSFKQAKEGETADE